MSGPDPRTILAAARAYLAGAFPGARPLELVVRFEDPRARRLILPFPEEGGPCAFRTSPDDAPRTYKLDATEKMILQALGRSYPAPLTLEELAATLKRSASTLTYKNRTRRLQEEGLIGNDRDHEGYRLTDEGERVAGQLLDEGGAAP